MQSLRFDSPQLKAIYTPHLSKTPTLLSPAPPHQQRWEVDEFSFRSTRELVSKSQAVAGKQATFAVKEHRDPPAPGALKKVGNALASGIVLSFVGGAAGAACGMFLELGKVFDSVISLGAAGGQSFAPWLAVGVGAAISGLAGAIIGYRAKPESPVQTLSGALQLEQTGSGQQVLAFYPDDDVKRRVDLTAAQGKPWWGGLKTAD